jgi:nucleoside-diphosphate-sugar epimerase
VTAVEVVYHIAATYREAGQPDSAYRAINVEGTRNILEAATDAGVTRSCTAAPAGCMGTLKTSRQ